MDPLYTVVSNFQFTLKLLFILTISFFNNKTNFLHHNLAHKKTSSNLSMDTLPTRFITFNPNSTTPPPPQSSSSSSSSSCSAESHLTTNGFNFADPILIPPTDSIEEESSDLSEESDSSNEILRYINEMLMGEEDLQKQNCMYADCMALQATEKSFYNLLNQQPHLLDSNYDQYPDGNFGDSHLGSSDFDQTLISDFDQTLISDLGGHDFGSNVSDGFFEVIDELVSPVSTLVAVPDSDNNKKPLNFGEEEKISLRNSGKLSNGRKFHELEEDQHFEGEEEEFKRSNKYSANNYNTENTEHLAMFDEVLLCNHADDEQHNLASCGDDESTQQNRVMKNGQSKNAKRNGSKVEMVDLRGLLTQCAQAVASNEQRNASDLLIQIRQHSSPFGDSIQRLAHFFAQGLEARLLGTKTQFQTIRATRTSAAEILKAYQVYLTSCPFKKMSNFFANKSILKAAEKATSIHIIDFGILYGFQWPCFLQALSKRKEGISKLRITGIELPQPGFRPSERVVETGRRLKTYCERFNVPFDYNPIAQKWETIKLEDLKIDPNELVIVNCLYRLENLPDDTTVTSSPRDAVLNLIRRIKPDLFIHGVTNGTYNAPFFLTRFRETLYHFSALFDMFEATIPHEDEERLLFEKEIFGRDAINVIACEGLERVDRPETYKQWQARNLRAGFKQVPLDKDLFRQVRKSVKTGYHKEFVVDENGGWMLQGWKGRIIYGLSCWKPAF